jgi:hypothetical protein
MRLLLMIGLRSIIINLPNLHVQHDMCSQVMLEHRVSIDIHEYNLVTFDFARDDGQVTIFN